MTHPQPSRPGQECCCCIIQSLQFSEHVKVLRGYEIPPLCMQTRLMAQQKQADGSKRYTSFLHALVTIPREEGLRAMWKGLTPRLMRIPPGQAIVWAVSDQITGTVSAWISCLSVLPARLLCGA
jgi:Mitochondrial carrier protein